ncbi:lipopolysaccharide biosynthesis protein [Georgenia yuyongxinii]
MVRTRMEGDVDAMSPARDDELDGEHSDSLTARVRRSLGWSLTNNVLARLGNMVSGIVLARLLVPEEYGVFATGMVVLTAALSMNELGVSLAIIRWPSGVDRIAPTVVTLAATWSTALFVIAYLGAPGFASALGAPDAATLIRVMAACILIDGLATVPAALMTRLFMQKQRMIVDLMGFVLGTTLTLVLAFSGAGAWAMVWGLVLTNVVTGVLAIVIAPRRYMPGFRLDVARELLAFGMPLAGASLLMFLMLNVDYVVVGSELDTEALGLYLLAFNLASWPVSLISVAVRRVSLAGFSRLAADPDRAAHGFARAAALVMAVSLPMCALMALYAVPGITLLYGERWLPAADALRFLSVLAAGRVAMELVYDFLVAMGRGRTNLWIQVLWVLLLAPALVIGARLDGIRGVSAGHAAVTIVMLIVGILAVRTSSVRLRVLAGECVRPVLATALLAVSAWPVLTFVQGAVPSVLLGAAIAAAVYVPIVLPLGRAFLRGGHHA